MRAALNSGDCILPKTNVALLRCGVTAHPYKQVFPSVIPVTQVCQPVLQSSLEQLEILFAKNSVALHWCWVIAHMCEQQVISGVIPVTQGCCPPALHSCPEQWELHFAKNSTCMNSKCPHKYLQGCCQPVSAEMSQAFCQKQRCTASVLGHYTPVCMLIGVSALNTSTVP